MLNTPTYFTTGKIVAIDPGTSHIGFAIFTISYQTNDILGIEAFTINATDLPKLIGIEEDLYADRNIRLWRIENVLVDILNQTNPSLVVCEAPFFNRFRPMAYAALVETVQCIRSCLFRWNPNILLEIVEPLLVKKTVKSTLTNNKNDVTTALKNIKGLPELLDKSLECYDEHSIDAIAVGYSYLTINEIVNKLM